MGAWVSGPLGAGMNVLFELDAEYLTLAMVTWATREM